MCGICGEFRFDGRKPDLALTHRMMEKLERRGPDHAGSYSDGPVALGHRRLSIIDLSEHSSQPMVDQELSLTIVFNGTIYNYPELRSELQHKGYHFFSSGDTEVILKAYAEWGEGCVERLHGMFAFAIWDMKRQQMFMARDRMGIKPYYYSMDQKRIRFASTTQALLQADDNDTSIDSFGLHNQLSLHAVIPAPRTILSGIRKMQPAHYMIIKADGSCSERRYWTLNASRQGIVRSDQEWIDSIHESLKSAVAKRKSIADVPVGVLLSGGLDRGQRAPQ